MAISKARIDIHITYEFDAISSQCITMLANDVDLESYNAAYATSSLEPQK
jgi:hypothetical protein